jgi:uncharacterized protein
MNELFIFVKYPEPGKVKTRLAKDIGIQKAASLYKEMVEQVMKQTQCTDRSYRRVVCFDPPDRVDEFRDWLDADEWRTQSSGDLGQRLDDAFKTSLKDNARCVVIGSDCIELTNTHVQKALAELKTHDLVIGPSHDGGYYLIACKKNYPELFCEIPWSTNQVFMETMKRAQNLRLTTKILEKLNDIDSLRDMFQSDHLLNKNGAAAL